MTPYNGPQTGGPRSGGYGFLVPGLNGYFTSVKLERAGAIRAQLDNVQEFGNFSSSGGNAPFLDQVDYIALFRLDDDLRGFEGGFSSSNLVCPDVGYASSSTLSTSYSCSTSAPAANQCPSTCVMRHYGYLIPFHNGVKFFGKVVRIDLQAMTGAKLTSPPSSASSSTCTIATRRCGTTCTDSVRREWWSSTDNSWHESGPASDDACITSEFVCTYQRMRECT